MKIGKYNFDYERFCKRISSITSNKFRHNVIFSKLLLAGIKEAPEIWLGKRLVLSILIAIIGLIIPFTVLNLFNVIDFENLFLPFLYAILLAIVFFFLTIGIYYLRLFYRIESRASMVDLILPDFLLLVSSNVKAGMTPYAAFRSAARNEFGPLADEVKIAATKSLGTESFSQALHTLSSRINSRYLKESVAFFSEAMKSGGHLAKLLESTAFDLRQTQEMKKELLSSTKMYVLFVAFAIIIATPLLLAISVQFLQMIENIQEESGPANLDDTSVGFLAGEQKITPAFMISMAYILMLINAFIASLLMGQLNTGKPKMGIKYFPVMLIVSYVFFGISLTGLSGFLG